MNTVTEEALVTGSPEVVWTLITEPLHFQEWYAFGGASIDLRPGGDITMRWDEHGDFQAVVEAVTPAKLLSFRWRPEPGPVVTITLESAGPGKTQVRIVESGDLEDPKQSALAWRNGLSLLTELANSRKTD
ncbi:MAG: SRPBCC domain-containing protein [Vicinamibacterales bacterium]